MPERSRGWTRKKRLQHENLNLNGYLFFFLEPFCSQSFSEFFANQSREREFRQQQPGIARMYWARMDIKPINRRSQKCRKCPCIPFQSRARLYMDAVSMAKPSRRDAKGKEIYSTSYEPSKVRCALVFFFCSPSRGQIFGLAAQ